ncbi:PREDICTED: uncharacterized protein LOC106811874 [Priapulus caudatus]|uniref:Uncharacterized protein LOC106811874 n=1 Tax=Priapulus caudatus TaxID=37621 RepID=A0ABM1EFW0_PRICU|nr:PREDICTED: uncharacterized protein LOC106811874 [Priapulus caudatus]
MARVVVLLLLVIAANEDCCGGQTLEPEPEYDPFYLPPLKSYSSPDMMPNVASRQEVVYPPVLPLLVKRSAEEETEGYESEAVEADDSLLAHSRFKRVGPPSGNGPASEHGRVPGSECPFFASEMEKNAVRDKMRELQDHTVKRRGKPAVKPWDKGCPTFQKDLLLTLDQMRRSLTR